jgi:DNA-directed RNA polymerase specialized sigma24 family protein
MTNPISTSSSEQRFAKVFGHLHTVVRYAARRGSTDPDGVAAEVMTIAWRRLDDVPADDPLPWLLVTARNLLMAERRRTLRQAALPDQVETPGLPSFTETSDGAVRSALLDLRPSDREALLLVAWDDLTPAQAARVTGTSAVAFRVRLHRARGRFARALARQSASRSHLHDQELESA